MKMGRVRSECTCSVLLCCRSVAVAIRYCEFRLKWPHVCTFFCLVSKRPFQSKFALSKLTIVEMMTTKYGEGERMVQRVVPVPAAGVLFLF